jgi:hypothetical protein
VPEEAVVRRARSSDKYFDMAASVRRKKLKI